MFNYSPIYRKNLDELGQNLDKIIDTDLLDDFSLALYVLTHLIELVPLRFRNYDLTINMS